MNITQVAAYWPFLQAIRDGKTVQFKRTDIDNWTDLTANEIECTPPDRMRVKPTPKIRAWTASDGPSIIGVVLRRKGELTCLAMVTGCKTDGLILGVSSATYSFKELMVEWLQLGGEPCGNVEEV